MIALLTCHDLSPHLIVKSEKLGSLIVDASALVNNGIGACCGDDFMVGLRDAIDGMSSRRCDGKKREKARNEGANRPRGKISSE